jgi:NAD(P) transhydrogenase subunit alpha
MKISTLVNKKEKRVAVTPETAKKYVQLGLEVELPENVGLSAGFSDGEYAAAGAKMRKSAVNDADVYVCVKPLLGDLGGAAADERRRQEETPSINGVRIAGGSHLVGLLSPYQNGAVLDRLIVDGGVNLYALELVPRITRAQSMDVLSSQGSIAGYRAVIEAMYLYRRVAPMMMTAAGTIRPAKVLILGAGVAGLQAIATAKRIGALVAAFDVRAAAQEQVESLGATFVSVESNESGEAAGGYAKEMSDAYKKRQSEKIAESIAKADIVISTAQIPGKSAPVLITGEMVRSMQDGSVIIDMATETGGNCELSERGGVIVAGGVTIVGYLNLAEEVAFDASQLFARNAFNFVSLMINDGKIDASDEIVSSTMIKATVKKRDIRENKELSASKSPSSRKRRKEV